MIDRRIVLLLVMAPRVLSFSWSTTAGAAGRLTRSVAGTPPVALLAEKLRSSTARYMSDYGQDMDQDALMESDMLIAVDEEDRLVGQGVVQLSKRDGHTFDAAHPRATLHRAFSFFLFDQTGRMLLTQRAASKITFPNVWTNTCCSHPLYGMTPEEADDDEAYPSFPGIKHAAIRKLRHELGIDSSYIQHDRIQFLSRFHYWAADTVTYGPEAPWGEHEVDYVLFLQSEEEVPVAANPDEVGTSKYVTRDELREMFADKSLLWSPWFRGMMDLGIWDWWKDLEGSLAGKYTNDQVTFFDPPAAHFASYNLPSHGRTTGVRSATTMSPSTTTSSK